MNKIILDGTIWGIQDSHTIGSVQYQKANITCQNSNGKESVLTLQFKKFQCPYKDGDKVLLEGNIRSFSEKVSDTKNRVSIYVYTYFDSPDCAAEELDRFKNKFVVDGRICKIEPMRFLENDKNNIHYILANNIIQNGSKLNSYLPCISWGGVANKIGKLSKNDKIEITGELRSREYKKPTSNGEFEIRVAHELLVTDFEVLSREE